MVLVILPFFGHSSALRAGYLPPDPFSSFFLSSPAFPSSSLGSGSGPRAGPGPVPGAGPAPARRSPLISIGTYLRCAALDSLVEQFILSASSHEQTGKAGQGGAEGGGEGGPGNKGKGRQVQIVSIGAGSDSRFWRIQVSPYGLFDAQRNSRNGSTRFDHFAPVLFGSSFFPRITLARGSHSRPTQRSTPA